MRRVLVLLLVPVVVFASVRQSQAYVHVGRSGETLSQLANFYYGDPSKEIIIRAANGFMHPDDGSVLEGEQVEVPEITFHRVQPGEDWFSLANQYLGSAKRAPFLAELNGMQVDTTLAPGQVVKIPYQLLYVFAPKETLAKVARTFYGTQRSAAWLRAYNLRRKRKFVRGDAILIPLIDIAFTDAAAEEIRRREQSRASAEDARVQAEAAKVIADMATDFDNGRYLAVVAAAQRLLAEPRLTAAQKIGVFKYLAFAYVAFGERDMARWAFLSALQIQPAMELSPITTSPKILDVFREAKQQQAQAAASGEGTP